MSPDEAPLLSQHDGDTPRLAASVGFDTIGNSTARWCGGDAPELAPLEGKAALAMLNQEPPETIRTMTTVEDHRGKSVRYPATFTLADGITVNAWPAKGGYAAAYDGEGKR